jgi:hypothetical protein
VEEGRGELLLVGEVKNEWGKATRRAAFYRRPGAPRKRVRPPEWWAGKPLALDVKKLRGNEEIGRGGNNGGEETTASAASGKFA